MAFTPISKFPAGAPTVRVFFSGLMIMKPSSDGKECEIYVHRKADSHQLSFEVRMKQPRQPDITLIRHFGHLKSAERAPGAPASSPLHGLLILCDTPKGVKRLDKQAATGENPLRGHALNFAKYHSGKTDVASDGGRPGLFFNDGIFYSAVTTPKEITLINKDEEEVDRFKVAATIGANIYNKKVIMKWKPQDKVESFTLEPQSDVSYEIHIINDPLFMPPPTSGDPPHDELGLYYKILPKIPGREKLKLGYSLLLSSDFLTFKWGRVGSTMIPCMPGIDDEL